MKIGVSRIVKDHFRTLRDPEGKRVLLGDLVLFYFMPIAFGFVIIDLTDPSPRTDWIDQALTFFGIFLALLINVQVALFAILQRGRADPSNKKREALQQDELELRRTLLGQVNATLSYLNLVCVIAIAASLLMSVVGTETRTTVLILLIFYVHFLLTMMMVLKRAHALFQKEYDGQTSRA